MPDNIRLKTTKYIPFLSFLLIIFIGFLDYISGDELSFSIFYLIPILIVAIHAKTTKTHLVVYAVFASVVWFMAEYYIKNYTNEYFAFWNAFVRFFIFLLVGYLALNLKKKQLKLSETNIELQHLNDEKNRFIGIAAHDLRNPIGTIFSFSDLLLSGYSEKMDPNTTNIVNYIKITSSNSLELLERLLDISKIESGTIELSLKKQDYIEFIKNNIVLNQILADKKEIDIKFESSEKELFIHFDDHYLNEVLNNLITNAVKFSYPKSEVLVKVTVSKNNRIKTEVIDKGRGIPKEEQAVLFGYFQKTSTKPTAGETSTGLGLAIAKKIIVEHQGQIDVKSEMNKGSNFYFELPQRPHD